MQSMLRNSICSILALFLAYTPAAPALQSTSAATGPVPPQIASAHAIFVSNGGGPNFFDAFSGGPNRGYSQLYADLQQWGRYNLVDSPSQADLVFEIHSVAPATDVYDSHGTSSVSYNPQLILRILDPKTNALLWTTTSNVRAAGTQASRDKGFDESVAVLLDRVRQLTGENLDTAQIKAIHNNSTMPRSEKIFIVSAIAITAGFGAFIAYKATHMSTPTLPTQPQCYPPFCPASTP